MSTVYSKDGSTYTTGGITYDTSTGRPVTPDGGFLLEAENIIVRKKRLITTISDVFSKAFDSLRKIK